MDRSSVFPICPLLNTVNAVMSVSRFSAVIFPVRSVKKSRVDSVDGVAVTLPPPLDADGSRSSAGAAPTSGRGAPPPAPPPPRTVEVLPEDAVDCCVLGAPTLASDADDAFATDLDMRARAEPSSSPPLVTAAAPVALRREAAGGGRAGTPTPAPAPARTPLPLNFTPLLRVSVKVTSPSFPVVVGDIRITASASALARARAAPRDARIASTLASTSAESDGAEGCARSDAGADERETRAEF